MVGLSSDNGGNADISAPTLGANQQPSQQVTKLIGQCRNRYYFYYEIGMRERSNPD
jgi:hypothetical protein